MAKKVHATGIVFEDESGRILVLRRNAESPEGRTWGLVGGKLDDGEDSKVAAIRETQEEVGHTVQSDELQFLKSYHWDRDDLDITFDVYKLSVTGDAVKLEVNQNEHSEHAWLLPDELYARNDLMKGLYLILEDFYEVSR
jgi:8-oxo-dGTP pyrophosphatase MutT (NUDIX family)